MKRSTAIRHLEELATEATDRLKLRETDIGWPLEDMWVAGDLLTTTATVEDSAVVYILDLPAEELSWLDWYVGAAWLEDVLRVSKRPLGWVYRPRAWPAWNLRHRRLARFWSAEDGLDQEVIKNLGEGRPESVIVLEPTNEALAKQLDMELRASRSRLRQVLDHYWDHDWRRKQRGWDNAPENHLWNAAQAVTEIQDALEELSNAGVDEQ